MATSVNDRRLVAGKKRTLRRLEKLGIEGRESRSLVETGKRVLEESIEDFQRAIRREDLTDEVRNILREPHGRTADALVRVYYSMKHQYAERRARGEAVTERDRKVEKVLRNLEPAQSIGASFPHAVSVLERAVEFASQTLPSDVIELSHSALDRAREARERLEKLGDRALRAYSNLEQARERAKSRYLAVREMISAAYRLEGCHDELNGVAPPISEIMSPS